MNNIFIGIFVIRVILLGIVEINVWASKVNQVNSMLMHIGI